MNRLKYIILLLGVAFSTLCAQNKQDYHWVMGYNGQNPHPDLGGTDWIFSDDSLRLSKSDRQANFYLTSASIADKTTGKLHYYSNGCAIYKSNNSIVINGDSINYGAVWEDHCTRFGYLQPQGGIMISTSENTDNVLFFHQKEEYFPVPGVTIGTNKLLLSKIGINSSQKSELVFKDSVVIDTMLQSGHLSAILHSNTQDWWVVQPGRYDDRYFIIKVSEQGVDTMFVQKLEHKLTSEKGGGGQACFSPNGQYYARFDLVEDGLFLMDFDRASGTFSNVRNIPIINDLDITGGCAFSPNSRFLYVTTQNQVLQYDVSSNDIEGSRVVVAEWDGFVDPFPTNFYLCNLGPDCRIYINSTSSARSMHVINYPDKQGLACSVAQHSIALPTLNLGTMPNFPHYRIDEDWPCDSTIGVKLTTSISLPKERVEFQISPNPADDILRLEYDLVGLDK